LRGCAYRRIDERVAATFNKNQAQMRVAATGWSAANLYALKQNPALAKHSPQ
jgi:hypothetical protein